MEDLIRLFIPNQRLKNLSRNCLILSSEESHYLNRVMRMKISQEIFIVNGKGNIWKAKKIDNKKIRIINYENPLIMKKKNRILLGIAVVIPKNGFEDILRMGTEIGVDIFQPLISERQIKKSIDFASKSLRWDSIINESLEQSERLWKPDLLKPIKISDWIPLVFEKDIVSISTTRKDGLISLRNWLIKKNISESHNGIIWNVIGPEGGWSKKELEIFNEYNIHLVKLSETILRTSTAAINATTVLNQWRNENIFSLNY